MSTPEPAPHDPVFAALDVLRGDGAHALLSKVIDDARSKGGVVVFDLDSTLLDNKARQARIMAEYGRAHGVAALSSTTAEHWEGWDYRRAMRNAGLPLEEVEGHVEPYREFWRERFFTSEYCRIDEAVVGAVRYVGAVREAGARVFYVTGRQEDMRAGSEESFRTLGFPVPDGDAVQLWMKPTLDEDDDAFKARVHADLRALGTPVAVFDNEPIHINAYRHSFPDSQVIHLATDHSMRTILVDEGIPSIGDFGGWRG